MRPPRPAVVHVAVDGTYAGYFVIGDEIRPDAQDAIKALRYQGIEHIAMLPATIPVRQRLFQNV